MELIFRDIWDTSRARVKKGRPPSSWPKAFLDALAKMANVRAAFEIAGFSSQTAYRTRLESQTFARQWDEAIEQACDRLEQEAWQRGVAGVGKPITIAGDREVTRKYSDRMLELKGSPSREVPGALRRHHAGHRV